MKTKLNKSFYDFNNNTARYNTYLNANHFHIQLEQTRERGLGEKNELENDFGLWLFGSLSKHGILMVA